jgi:hypothetical protein
VAQEKREIDGSFPKKWCLKEEKIVKRPLLVAVNKFERDTSHLGSSCSANACRSK